MNPIEYLIASHWYYALILIISNHGVALTTPSLAICEETTVVTFPSVVQDLGAQSVVDQGLIGIL